MKTNAARILDGLGIRYELRDYEVDEEDLSAESVARKVGLPPEQVFKTLVVRGDRNGVCLAAVPAGMQLDLGEVRYPAHMLTLCSKWPSFDPLCA